MFKEQYIRDNDKIHAKETLFMEIQKKASEDSRSPQRQARLVRWGAVAAAAVLVVGGCLGIALGSRSAPAAGAQNQSVSAADQQQDVLTFTSYDELYDLLENMNGTGGMARDGAVTNAAPEAVAEEAAPAAEAPASADSASYSMAAEGGEAKTAGTSADSTEYSTTNVQVAGVDEADVVKTDGSYIYYIASGKLYILKAEGADTRLVSATALESDDAWWGFASELFLLGDRLMVITQGSSTVWVNGGEQGFNTNQQQTRAILFDLSDRARPKQIVSLGQSGNYVSSRMVGEEVYLVTSQYVWQYARANPESFVPQISTDGASSTIAPADIVAYGNPQESAYTVIGSINLKSGTRHDTAKAIFGGTSNVYCNGTQMLLSLSENDSTTGEIHPEEKTGKNVRITNSETRTKLMLFSLDGGSVQQIATGSVPGSLLNQFSVDAYKGVYRIVTTVDTWEERIYTDGVDTYAYDSKNYNCLYTLDESLRQLGSIENIAADEWVQSVRFDGDVGYFVTFRQTDPLFTVDLSNPASPKILGALKIPGFSEYLHVYGDGLLLGLGYDADEKTGATTGVKLSMFRTADPANVTELATEKIDASWTVVGSNHKAILVQPDRNLIAFPADSAYYLYRYDADKGFTLLKKITMTADLYSWNLRGLFVGDNFYVLSDSSVTVISLTDLATIATLKLS